MIDPNNPNGVVKIGSVTTPQTTLVQDQARAANQGKAGYDVLGNPLNSSVNTGLPTAPSLFSESPEEKALREATSQKADYYKDISSQNVNEEQLRADALSQFQGEINAQNEIYAQKLKQAMVQGQGRLGVTGAINARSGLLGSNFGAAETDKTNQANSEIYSSIEQEKGAAISQLYTKARDAGTKAIADKRAAKEAGLDSYIESLAASTENKKKISSSLAQQILLTKLDPTKDADAIKQAASDAGVTVESILSSYRELEKTQKEEQRKIEAEKKKLELDTMKANPASVQEYLFAKENGYDGTYNEYQNADANRKVSIAKAGVAGLTPYQQFQATQSIAKDTQARTTNAREMARQAELIQSSYNNIVNGGDKSLNTQAIVTAFNKILDPTSVVRESEYDRTAQGQSLLAQLQGKVQNISEGGAGVTPQTLKEASDIAKKYLDGAKASIAQQNQRAEQMASQFGLNPSFVTSTFNEPTGGGSDDELLGNFGL